LQLMRYGEKIASNGCSQSEMGQEATMGTFDSILAHQLAWAQSRAIPITRGYTESLEQNLLAHAMLPETKMAFVLGSGDDLVDKGGPAHIRALISPSALVLNFFEYWIRDHRTRTIAGLCGCGLDETSMVFEAKHKIEGLGTRNIDIEFDGGVIETLAIDSKFTEPYQGKVNQPNGANLDKYLAKTSIWQGLEHCRSIAERILGREGLETDWKYLDIPQLLKHILGLKERFGPRGFHLLYLWYDFPSLEGHAHGEEIKEFEHLTEGDISVRDITYQELFRAIQFTEGVDQEYVSYLRERYFPENLFGLRAGTRLWDARGG
jgi:hypothetical protein